MLVVSLEFEIPFSVLCCRTSLLLPPRSDEEEGGDRSREASKRGSVTSSMLRNPTDRCFWLQASTPLVGSMEEEAASAGSGLSSVEKAASSSPSSCPAMPPSLSMQGQEVQGAGRKVAVMLYKGWAPYPAGHQSSSGPGISTSVVMNLGCEGYETSQVQRV